MVLHHLTDFTVPWTSNLAEQALRHVKIHLKISGCFRSLITTRAYCRIHSYLITIRLNAVPPMQAIRDALAGRAWTPRLQLYTGLTLQSVTFIDGWNDRCHPFTWTKTADEILAKCRPGKRTSFTRH